MLESLTRRIATLEEKLRRGFVTARLIVAQRLTGGVVFFNVDNTDNSNAASHARIDIVVGGASGGDPLITWSIQGAQDWYAGVDNSDSDKFEIGTGNAVGIAAKLTLTTAGNLTLAGTLAASDVLSGSYTPTLTAVTNVAASTAYSAQYIRVGNAVTVSGQVDIDPTATGSTKLGISLPVASNFANANECGGVASSIAVAQAAGIYADAANDRASLEYIAASNANTALLFTFTYRVI